MRRSLTTAFVAATVTAFAAGTAGAQPGHTASSTLVELSIDDAPAAGVTGFGGTLGHVRADPSEVVSWDKSDPDGVLPFLNGWYGGTPGTANSTAQVDEPSGTHRAEATGSGVGLRLTPDANNLISFGSVHTWAQCTHAPAQETEQAYAATDSNQAYLFDDVTRPLTDGAQTVRTDGAELGLPAVGSATLIVTIDHIERTAPGSAHAAIEIHVTAVLEDTDGRVIYAGSLLDATIGEVTVQCTADVPVTTTTTSPPTPPTTTTAVPTTTTGTTTGTPPTSGTSTGAPTSSGVVTPGGGRPLANTGLPLVIPGAVGLALAIGGAWLLLRQRRSARRG
ncbi:hypothetical protein BLA60_37215 [Actinophytocola xinjiangensis]|uniref:LPXTG-motif cell wall-anchored protein n=1 Tax=Actinophytocola xinjiangensis TaxID=485602 RepID=A0A7Z1AUJ6_9PSEU|nr:hypothetical protein [Actinophytocola xinjiangensis]OLF05163.1 hypothetical protein BLA60_37215 [Actinophytocola xinjiangensis]